MAQSDGADLSPRARAWARAIATEARIFYELKFQSGFLLFYSAETRATVLSVRPFGKRCLCVTSL